MCLHPPGAVGRRCFAGRRHTRVCFCRCHGVLRIDEHGCAAGGRNRRSGVTPVTVRNQIDLDKSVACQSANRFGAGRAVGSLGA
ncbi:hypothetical protein OPAG_09259 [Rhodococcus opacus PD630]|nr:hypothetical protein Pd630_LPD00199 [Rhodococcus opacus PD630]EHI47546.1 hypothetical protein OPAG_09259 [Rhodococcus opacus PD630]